MWSRIRRATAIRGGNAGDGDGSGEGCPPVRIAPTVTFYGRANQRSVLVKLLGADDDAEQRCHTDLLGDDGVGLLDQRQHGYHEDRQPILYCESVVG